MKVYYHSSEVMMELQDMEAQLVVTSPPYPMINKWDKAFGKVDFEYQHSILDRVWKECYRVLIDGGICCINIGDATRSIEGCFQCFPNFARVTMGCMKVGFVPLIPILWKKISNRPNAFLGSGFLPPNAYVAQDCEYIAIFRKGRELRKFGVKDRNRYKSQYTKKERDEWFQQIWEVGGVKGAKQTSSFPDEIPYRLIRMFSVIGDMVVDPFCGVGTTGRVAKTLERDFVGYEIEREEKGK